MPIPKWEKLIIQRSDFSAIRMENNTTEYLNAEVDTIKHELHITFKDDINVTHKFSYHSSDSENMELTGIYFDKPLRVKLKKQHFELAERSFHWISEDPYNR